LIYIIKKKHDFYKKKNIKNILNKYKTYIKYVFLFNFIWFDLLSGLSTDLFLPIVFRSINWFVFTKVNLSRNVF
jgi:hypothetical protein